MTDFLFADAETSIHDGADLTRVGHMNYAQHPDTCIRLWSFALDDGDAGIWEPGQKFPKFVRKHVEAGGLIVCWNAQFDRAIWQQIGPEVGMPEAKTEQFLDAMAQGSVSGLPGRLDQAGQALGLGGKMNDGKAVMLECGRLGRKGSTFEKWSQYREYARRDVVLMRDIWQRTLPLALEDWEDYWVSEKINDRGLPMDMRLARGAAGYFEVEKADVTQLVQTISGIPNQWCSAQINKWVTARISKTALKIMKKKNKPATREARKKDPDAPVVYKLSLERDRLTRLRDKLKGGGGDKAVIELLTVLEWGRSSSAAKFRKIVDGAYDRLYGAYVFNGAGQTGRYSSRGVQWHNTPRARIGSEILDDQDIPKDQRYPLMVKTEKMALEMIRKRVDIEELRQFGPISRTLSRAARPCIRAFRGHRIVWADYKSIEARVTPWLAFKAGIEEADAVLKSFRQGKDLYVQDAAAIFDVDEKSITDTQRQAGKIARLSLGFRGGKGAYQQMAAGFGLIVPDDRADRIVKGWREANLWNAEYADMVWSAILDAFEDPGVRMPVGDCSYWFEPGLMRGSLVAQLPSKRCLVYPSARMRREEHEELGFETTNIHYGHHKEQTKGWVGTFLENLVQATANDLLRRSLKNLDTCPYIVGHTHDDIIGHCPEDHVEDFESLLVERMVEHQAPWAEGLPLGAEAENDRYYHK